MVSSRRRGARAGILFVAGLLAGGEAAAQASTSPEELFARGNEQYARGNYAAAAEAYERILKAGIRNSRVYYNLGNACFKQNRIGQSILHYERALKLDPADADARENLRYANLRIRDRIPAEDVPYLLEVLTRIRNLLGLEELARLFLGLYWTVMILSAGWIVVNGRRGGAALGIAALALSGLTLLAGGWMILQARDRAVSDEAIVLSEKAEVLSGPGSENTLLASVHEGTKVRVHNRREDWVQVTLPDGRAGWIREDALDVI